jgi:uncharacterized protein (TIGR03435 family)
LLLAAGAVVLATPLVTGVLGEPRLRAQAPATTGDPTFEVASVKPNKTGDNGVRIGLQPGGRFITTNTSLRQLVTFAYQLQSFQLVGGPDWMGTDRFDITAKAEGEIPPTPPGTVGPMQLMMRSLLADRFGVVVHREQRDMPIYALVVVRADKRLGPKLQASTVDCQAMMTANMSRGGPPPGPPPTAPSGRPICGMRTSPGQMMGGGFPLSQLASALSQMVQRTVVDQTGLTGNYDLELTYTPDQAPRGDPPPGAPALPPIDPNGPSIFTALQEQLGLKLDSQRGPVDVVVVDKAERPKED